MDGDEGVEEGMIYSILLYTTLHFHVDGRRRSFPSENFIDEAFVCFRWVW